MTQEALKLALDFVETVHVGEWVGSIERQLEVITAIKEVLAQPEQEPVALETLLKWDDDIDPIGEVVGFIEGSPYIMVKVHKGKQVSLDDDLYATPPQRNEQCNYPDCKCPTENPCLKKLAQPVQEPVAWQFMNGSHFRKRRPDDFADLDSDGLPYWKPLYTTPPQRTWVGLTDDEIAQGWKESWVTEQAWQSAVWWAEAKLKEKNT